MPLNDIVNVVITRQTQTVTEQGFGIPMILGTSNRFMELIRFYTSIDEVALDFGTNDLEYIAAQDIFSQVISPEQIAIGRRLVNNVDVLVETAMTGVDYILNINGNEITASSSSTSTFSIVSLNADLVPGNLINVSVNTNALGTITSVIDFDNDFVTGNSIQPMINGATITAIPYNVSGQAATMTDIAAALTATPAIVSATVAGDNRITAIFAAPGNNTINSVVTTGGASQPDALISEGAFAYVTSSEQTMQDIANAIIAAHPTWTATVSPAPGRILTVEAPTGQTATINSFVVSLGASRAIATITNPLQAVDADSIVDDLVTAINAAIVSDPSFPVTAVNAGNGILRLTNAFTGTPWTLEASSTIGAPNQARVSITQVEPNQVYTVTVNGLDFTYVSQNNVQNGDQIATALVDLINATPRAVPVTANNNDDGTFDLVSDNLTIPFAVSASADVMTVQKGLIVLPLVAANPVADDLTAINNSNDTWYALISTSRDVATVKAIAAWTEARIKLFGTASNDPNIINVAAGTDTTSIAAFLNQLGYVRTFVMYHQDALTDFPEAAWFGRVLPLVPGSETWKFKSLNGISNSNLTTNQSNNALNKKANTFEFIGGVGITQNGTVAQGEYIDIIRGIDWLRARIQEFVFSVLVNTPKVAYTDAGITVIQSEVMRALQLGVDNNFIAVDPKYIVTVPLAANVSPADKAARILRDVKFSATLSGAIHAVFITGNVSV